VWVSLGLSATQQAILTILVGLIVVGLVAVIWQTSVPVEDDQTRPVARPADMVAPPTSPVTSASTPPHAPAGTPRLEPFEPTSLAPATPAKPDPADVASLEASRAAFDQQLIQRPDDADVLNRKGQALERLGEIGEAATCFERAVALAPETRSYHLNLARVDAALGQADRAIAQYREVVRLQPDDYSARYTLGMSLHRIGDEEAAIPEFQKAAALGPAEPSFRLALGVSLERAGRLSEAVREYERFVAMQPSSGDARRLKDHLAALSAALK
jgi:Flp pilus assembly protein TadD